MADEKIIAVVGATGAQAGGHLTGAQMAASLTRALGQEVHYNDVPPDVCRRFGFPGAEDTGNMFRSNVISRRCTATPAASRHPGNRIRRCNPLKRG